MVRVTDRALGLLVQAVQSQELEEDDALRLTRTGDGLELRIGSVEDDDRVIAVDDRPVLIVNATLEEQLGDITLDQHEESISPALVLLPGDDGSA